MNDKKVSKKVSNDVKNNKEEFVIPFEAACSPEFANGCFIMEDEADKEEEKK